MFHFADAYRRIKHDLYAHHESERMTSLVNENDDDDDEGIEDDDEIEDNPDLSTEEANFKVAVK